jgi:hypothetical protein
MRILIASLIVLVSIAGCSGKNSNGAPSPKAIANTVFKGLKEDAFGKIADLALPDESDNEAFVRQNTEEKEEDIYERKYNRQKWVKELEYAFNIVRGKYNEEAWKTAEIVGYDGLDDYRRYAQISITIQLEGRQDKLYIGEAKQQNGKWYLTTTPEWD